MKEIKIITSILILFGLMILSSCGEDAFATTVALDEPEVDPKLVVNAFVFDEGQEDLHVYVGQNIGILTDGGNFWNEEDSYSLNDATVSLTKLSTNEVLDFEYVLDSEYSNFGRDDFNYLSANIASDYFEGGENYNFNISHSQFENSSTVLGYPKLVEIQDLIFEREGGVDEEGDEASSITFSFQDEPGVNNYYEVALFMVDSILSTQEENFDNIWINSSDLSHSRGRIDANILLEDESFDGTLKTLEIKVSRYYADVNEPIFVELRAINEGFYKYTKTFRQAVDTNDNPFASPVQIHTNVDKGLGVIALKNADRKQVK